MLILVIAFFLVNLILWAFLWITMMGLLAHINQIRGEVNALKSDGA